jgi:pimeloyl-ACP methyl ester carboxylesterase
MYQALHPHKSTFVPIRGLRYHVRQWGEAHMSGPDKPPLVLLHGWMDVGASYQFLVDALAQAEQAQRWVLAPDWRGFGLTVTPGADTYWFPDYLADLDALLDALLPAPSAAAGAPDGAAAEPQAFSSATGQPAPRIDLLGHSMGGNVAMAYAGVRPSRVRRLVNLEGFGMPRTRPDQAPKRLAQWLDELKTPSPLRSYDSLADVAARLQANNPLLSADKAAWLAPHWSALGEDGQWHILGHPAHKRVNPVLYQVDEALATWQQITAPVLWLEGDRTDLQKWWGQRYTKEEFHQRLSVVAQVQRATLSPCGHMLHHDQPQALAQHLARFLA